MKTLYLALLIVTLPSIFHSTATANFEQKATELFNKLVNLADNSLNWRCFAQKMANALQESNKHLELVPVFNNLATRTSAMDIAWDLMEYEDNLPESFKKRINDLSYSTLGNAITHRIALNDKVNC